VQTTVKNAAHKTVYKVLHKVMTSIAPRNTF